MTIELHVDKDNHEFVTGSTIEANLGRIFSAPTMFAPLSLYICCGFPLRDMNLRRACKKESVVRDCEILLSEQHTWINM